MVMQADARVLPIAAESVQCVVTSPPYFGLRDYGVSGQIGLEQTPAEYVAALVAVFREVWRVLKPNGTVWLNLGDSYANDGKWGGHSGGKHDYGSGGLVHQPIGRNKRYTGLKPKDLIGIPWRVAFALQADGWWLRSDVIWSKPNPMPESVTDRPTRAHEYLFLLTKRERYYYDAAAITEPASDAMIVQIEQGYNGSATKDYESSGAQNPSSVKSRIIGNARKRADRFGGNKHGEDSTKHSDGSIYTGRPTRNRRSVWTVTTQPYPDAHFATFPEKLIEPCILAGSRPGDVVLDPFVGSGTTVRVARRYNRVGVGCDLNRAYLAMAQRRATGFVADLLSAEQPA